MLPRTDLDGPGAKPLFLTGGVSTTQTRTMGTTTDTEAAEAQLRPTLDPFDPANRKAADLIMQRLIEHERVVDADRALPARSQVDAVPRVRPEAAGDKVGFQAELLKESLRDPRAKVLDQLERHTPNGWEVPGNLSERVAPHLLQQIFANHPSAASHATRWIQDKQLERNHVAHEMMLLCMVLDKSLLDDKNYISTQACEIVCRRVYALKKAFEGVKCAADWRQPKGAAASKWKSKVRWDLANEIDMRAVLGDTDALPAVDRELQGRLRDRALMSKYIEGAAAGAPVGEDE